MSLMSFLREAAAEFGIIESDADKAYPDRCDVCERALRSVHRHGGVRVFPAPTTARPALSAPPRREPIDVRVVR